MSDQGPDLRDVLFLLAFVVFMIILAVGATAYYNG